MQCQAVVTGVKSETVLSDHIANRRFCGYASTPSGEFMEFRLLNQNLFLLQESFDIDILLFRDDIYAGLEMDYKH